MNLVALPFALTIFAVLLGVFLALREQGPVAAFVLIGRYTIWPFLAIPVALAAGVGLVLWPTVTSRAFFAAGYVLLVVAVFCRWGPGTGLRAIRRMSIRSRWPSVARSAGLGVRQDRRSRRWPGGVSSTVVGAEVIEHLPRIWKGRGLAGGIGVTYRVRPARGATLSDLQGGAPKLAAGLKAHSVVVERETPSRGRLTILYRDTLTRKS